MSDTAKRLSDAIYIMQMVADGRYTLDSMRVWLKSNYPTGRYVGEEQSELPLEPFPADWYASP